MRGRITSEVERFGNQALSFPINQPVALLLASWHYLVMLTPGIATRWANSNTEYLIVRSASGTPADQAIAFF